MFDSTKKLKEIVIEGLQVVMSDMKNLSRTYSPDEKPKFYVGDQIEFDILLENEHDFSLQDLEITIHEMEAVSFAESPIVVHCEHLDGQSEKKIKTIKGTIVADPDDALTPWVMQDYVCRVTIAGNFDLPRLEFHDEELTFAYIKSE
jgi:hypothetical protein